MKIYRANKISDEMSKLNDVFNKPIKITCVKPNFNRLPIISGTISGIHPNSQKTLTILKRRAMNNLGRSVVFDPALKWTELEKDQNNSRHLDSVLIDVRSEDRISNHLPKHEFGVNKKLTKTAVDIINEDYDMSFSYNCYANAQHNGAWKILNFVDEKLIARHKALVEEIDSLFFNRISYHDDSIFVDESPQDERIKKIQEYNSSFNFKEQDLETIAHSITNSTKENVEKDLNKGVENFEELNWVKITEKLSFKNLGLILGSKSHRGYIPISVLLEREDIFCKDFLNCLYWDDLKKTQTKIFCYLFYKNNSLDFYEIVLDFIKDFIKKDTLYDFSYFFFTVLSRYFDCHNKNINEKMFLKTTQTINRLSGNSDCYDFYEKKYKEIINYSDEFFQKDPFFKPNNPLESNIWPHFSSTLMNAQIEDRISFEEFSSFVKKHKDDFDFGTFYHGYLTVELMGLFIDDMGQEDLNYLYSSGSWTLDALIEFQDKINLGTIWINYRGNRPNTINIKNPDDNDGFIRLSYNDNCKEFNKLIDLMINNINRLNEIDKESFLLYFNSNNLTTEIADKLFHDNHIDSLPNVQLAQFITVRTNEEENPNYIDF